MLSTLFSSRLGLRIIAEEIKVRARVYMYVNACDQVGE